MEDSKPFSTPMVTSCKLRKDDEYLELDHTMYRYMIGSMVSMIARRLDVIQEIGLFSRFQSAPKETHVTAVKIILRYLKGTIEYGLWNPRGQYFTLKEFNGVDWVGSVND